MNTMKTKPRAVLGVTKGRALWGTEEPGDRGVCGGGVGGEGLGRGGG